MSLDKTIVVIPVKNDAARLKVCLESIAKQIPTNQIRVVDNGSADDSVEVAKKVGCLVQSAAGLRVGAMRNRAVSTADTPIQFIAFCDSDHEVAADWLATGLSVLQSDRSILATGSHYLPPPNGTWVQRVWAIHRLRGAAIRNVDWLGSGNLFVRMEDFRKIGGFREDLTAAEDVDLCHRLRNQLSGKIVCDDRIRSIHHGEPKRLIDFYRKEYWRGSSGLKAWFSQGMPLRELPSLAWPVWHLLGAVAVAFYILVALWQWGFAIGNGAAEQAGSVLPLYKPEAGHWVVLCIVAAWITPAVLLALKVGWQEKRLASIPQLAVLYFVYGLARAAALRK